MNTGFYERPSLAAQVSADRSELQRRHTVINIDPLTLARLADSLGLVPMPKCGRTNYDKVKP
jgi:hypothetical protein